MVGQLLKCSVLILLAFISLCESQSGCSCICVNNKCDPPCCSPSNPCCPDPPYVEPTYPPLPTILLNTTVFTTTTTMSTPDPVTSDSNLFKAVPATMVALILMNVF